jgi:hypothetical protein
MREMSQKLTDVRDSPLPGKIPNLGRRRAPSTQGVWIGFVESTPQGVNEFLVILKISAGFV